MRPENFLPVVCISLFVTSGRTIETTDNKNENYATGDAENATRSGAESVTLHLHIKGTENSFKVASVRNAGDLCAFLDFDCPTVKYIHGWNGNWTARDVVAVTREYILRGDHNVIIVDWGEVAGQFYPLAAAGTKEVGIEVAKGLDVLVKCGLRPESLHIVGHSLGSHVAGHVAKNAHSRLKRITALDPAGPLFNIILEPLTKNDAEEVVAIHTDMGVYGVKLRTGTVDFYPNGGHRFAPGCPKIYVPLSEEDFCSHWKSWGYYAESVRNETAFYAVSCHSHSKFKVGLCKKNPYTVMGFATPSDVTGKFYLDTNADFPYGMGKSGMRRTS
ncbi:lipase member H-A-like [Athalia rosae]|uniref:lipase member H-A-like n=1 Tax=Athalia rosae TaxID=37344 RepID=UPI0020334B1F|nr:lipase member H-A-like [Athalia rosae]